MYQEFFSLNKQPFSISPDPDFMFLSERHKEALAHLTYGLQDNGGFVLLTGEVGTGKTTVCRALLQDMPTEVDVAFILNPALSEIELLATICDEFNIEYEFNLKSIFDSLNGWMMDNLRLGRAAIVLIDEAQHLSFSALEQLRLLTNIESNNKKPLQVILIGQTELQQKLKQKELRQLAQRITARYHLLPLSPIESEYYIQHRLNVAGASFPLFQPKALKKIIKMTQGVPRLINLLCDRSLLSAYGNHAPAVSTKMVSLAASEIGIDAPPAGKKWQVFLLVLLLIVAAIQAKNAFEELPEQAAEALPIAASTEIIAEEKSEPAEVTVEQLAVDNELTLKSPHIEESRWFEAYPSLDLKQREFAHALLSLYAVWGYQLDLATVSCEQGKLASLLCFSDNFTLAKIVQTNYPAVIKLENGEQYVYAVMYKAGENYQLLIGEQMIEVSEGWLVKYWKGGVTLLWKTPFEFQESLQFGQQSEKVAWLVKQLDESGGRINQAKDRFDLALFQQVVDFQRKMDLKDDGVVGVRTMMALMQLTHPELPRLINEGN